MFMSQPTEYAVGFSAGAAACMYIFRQSASMLKEQREQKERKNGNGNGVSANKPVEFWQREFREAVVEGFTTAVAPILQNQTRILEELRDSQRGIDTAITKLTTIAEFQK